LAESERVEKIFRANGPPIQAVVAILISDKIDFRLRSIKGDNEDHFINNKRNNSSRENNNS
jgi:hypothetical protein